MKNPSTTTLLGLAVLRLASGTSAFVQPTGPSKAYGSSLYSSVSADAFFPGRRSVNNGSSSTLTKHHRAVTRQQPLATPVPKPVTGNMELIDQLKHDATVIFSIIDADGSGYISRDEFASHLTDSGSSASFVDQLFDRLDLDGDGNISDTEFRTLYLAVPSLRSLPGMGQTLQVGIDDQEQQKTSTYEDIMAAGDQVFASLDKDGNGYVDFAEVQAHLANLGKRLEHKAVVKIFNLLDEDDDLSIGKKEFRDAYWRYSAFRKALGESL